MRILVTKVRRSLFPYYVEIRNKFFLKSNSKKLNKIPKFSKVTIEIFRNDIGFFAFLNWFLYLTKYLESMNLQPDIILKSRNYGDASRGYNILSERLEKKNAGIAHKSQSLKTFKIKSMKEIITDVHLGIDEANAIQSRTLIPSTRIAEIVKSFISTEICGDFFSIHWRGTDKISEAEPISVEYILFAMETLMKNKTIIEKTCFIASDEETKIIQLKNQISLTYPNLKVVHRENTLRSTDGIPVHLDRKFSEFDSATLGDEALIECLILAQSSFLIKTTSFLSAWSLVFNPTIPVFYLNKPYPNKVWFPDSELLYNGTASDSLR